jgi:hypothetical protein
LLATTRLAEPLQRRFVEKTIAHEGPASEFWESLRQDQEFGEATVKTLQFTLQMGLLSGNYVPLAEWAQKEREAGRIKDLRDLAGMSVKEWKKVIGGQGQQQGTGTPPSAPGEDDVARAKAYATSIANTLEEAFPGDRAAADLKRDDRYNTKAGLMRFLNNTSGAFDLVKDNIDLFEKKHGPKVFGRRAGQGGREAGGQTAAPDPPIAPKHGRFETAAKLLENGFVRGPRGPDGEGRFVRKYGVHSIRRRTREGTRPRFTVAPLTAQPWHSRCTGSTAQRSGRCG